MARRALLLIAILAASAVPGLAAGPGGIASRLPSAAATDRRPLDPTLQVRVRAPRGTSRVIIETVDGAPADELIRVLDGRPGRRLALLGGQVAEIPNAALEALAGDPRVRSVRLDRPVRGTMERTGATVGATWVRENLGVDGSGVGVALVDAGVTPWHDDLGPDRVVHFADFVDFQAGPYDEYGHGTHVAGIISGSGYDSNGARRGIAPGSHLVVLKVLDADGNGYISNVIAALDYAVQHRAQYNIRVINLSVATGVYESYHTDPLTLAARRAVEAGIVVVTAAGNLGRDAKGQAQSGGVTSPGNAPWVLTVGATSHNGTATRSDDSIAPFSSRGPTYIDSEAKPDLVAPGVGIESLADASSALFARHPAARLWGTVDTVTQPYLSLTGTSMAAPVVAGTVALMLQANPTLTPNLVKAILQYTAEHRKYDDLTQGAGFLNARGAVQLSRYLGGDRTALQAAKDPTPWNAHVNWGNHRIGGGVLRPRANAWRPDVMWGAATTAQGDNVIWGTLCSGADCTGAASGASSDEDNIVWGTSCTDAACSKIVWGASSDGDNIVWGATCPGTDCDTAVWGTSTSDSIVWTPSCGGSCGDVVFAAPAAVEPRREIRKINRTSAGPMN
ncbi:MAG: S8 family peptidase [Acidobacteriota bacterium]